MSPPSQSPLGMTLPCSYSQVPLRNVIWCAGITDRVAIRVQRQCLSRGVLMARSSVLQKRIAAATLAIPLPSPHVLHYLISWSCCCSSSMLLSSSLVCNCGRSAPSNSCQAVVGVVESQGSGVAMLSMACAAMSCMFAPFS